MTHQHMRPTLALALLLCTASALLAEKKVISPTTTASNDQIDLEATITMAEPEVTQKIGADPGAGIVLMQVKVTPKTDKPVQISPDDFILLAHDDGERSRPFTPSELAGQGALIVSTSKDSAKQKKGSVGFGVGPMMGGSGASPGTQPIKKLDSKVDSKREGNKALLEALKVKQFPTVESLQPVEGYLYFPLDGKHKLKNLALLYRGPAGRMNLEFEH